MSGRDQVLAALNAIPDPATGQGLADAGLVRGLVVSDGRAGFMLEVPAELVARYEPVRAAAEHALVRMGFEKAQVVLTAEAANPKPASARLSDKAAEQNRPKAPVATARPAHVKRVIAVGSGKGGVGKSTVSLNLALSLSALGLNVGFLDADIYGPSAPVMLGIRNPPAFGPDKLMVPPEAFGVKVNSVGFLVDADQAMVWRGPMASQALTQLLTQTRWATEDQPLDVLVVDLPPGTGDVHLTLLQKTLVDGAIVVSTPQEMALSDARRAVILFEKTGIKVLGIVENMAYFPAPDGSEIAIFGRGGAARLAAELELPLLAELPLDPALREACDEARPLTVGATADRFRGIAQAVMAGF